MTNDSFRYAELFAGIGGFHLGLKSLGGQNVFASEWDKHAAQTYLDWYPHVNLDTRDVRTIDIDKDIPMHDVLCGGFPCQPFSVAGVSKKNSLGRAHGFEDERQGNLFFTIASVIEAKRPKIVFLENVKNLRSHDKGNTWKTIQTVLEELGYLVHSSIIDAAAWVPQHRERLFIVAFDLAAEFKLDPSDFSFPNRDSGDYPRFADILDPEVDGNLELSEGLWSYLQKYAEKHKELGNGFGFQIARPDGVSRTLSARYYKDGSEILISDDKMSRPRKLSYEEAKRLMGFSGEFEKYSSGASAFRQVGSYSQSLKQFGNAVVPKVVQEIGREFISHLELPSDRRASINPKELPAAVTLRGSQAH